MTKVIGTRIKSESSFDMVLDERDKLAIAFRSMLLNDPRGSDSNITTTSVDCIMRSLQNTGVYTTDSKGEPCITLESLASGLQKLFKDEISLVSDGNHTFNELYDHRCTLFCSLISALTKSILPSGVQSVWFSKKHSDGTMFEGYIIVGISSSQGDCTYHMKEDPYYNYLKNSGATELSRSPEWDGHNSSDVLDRLTKLFLNKGQL